MYMHHARKLLVIKRPIDEKYRSSVCVINKYTATIKHIFFHALVNIAEVKLIMDTGICGRNLGTSLELVTIQANPHAASDFNVDSSLLFLSKMRENAFFLSWTLNGSRENADLFDVENCLE